MSTAKRGIVGQWRYVFVLSFALWTRNVGAAVKILFRAQAFSFNGPEQRFDANSDDYIDELYSALTSVYETGVEGVRVYFVLKSTGGDGLVQGYMNKHRGCT